MSVRKRKWTTRSGEAREAWIVDYIQDGERHIETFKRKKVADAYAQQVGVDIRAGTHTPVSKSITVAQAAEDWIKSVELDGREASTLALSTASTQPTSPRASAISSSRKSHHAARQHLPR